MKLKRKSIAIDMDGVIADVETQFINWYERDFGIRVRKEDLLGKPEGEAFPDQQALKSFCFTPGFFSSLPVMVGAQEIVNSLTQHYDVYIVSAAMEFPLSLYEKYQWLQKHFSFISWKNIIFCGDKSIIGTDYLIDDHLKNLDFCCGKPIMYTASHNYHYNHHLRVNNWKEVSSFFEKEITRE